MLSPARAEKLKPVLEDLLQDCDYAARRAHDPVEFAWTYPDSLDREFVALLSSCLAYGRVSLLKKGVREVLDVLGARPSLALSELGLDALETRLGGFVYRMSKGADVVDLVAAITALQQEFGSIEQAYWARDAERAAATHLERSSRLVRRLWAARVRPKLTRGFRYLLPDPADGSTCKRLHLFFRWMGRGPDGIDLGLWESLSPSELIMPLDTHTSRLCRYLGMTERKSTDLKAALEVTRSLALMDPEDPLKYDFALCHLGISGGCIHRRSEEHCPTCPIESMCTLGGA
jgi:uncharacterized protein (TIGR02757 family)